MAFAQAGAPIAPTLLVIPRDKPHEHCSLPVLAAEATPADAIAKLAHPIKPASGMIEKKSTYFRKNGDVILEAGIYKGR